MSNTSSASARFAKLVQNYYSAWFRYHPEAAVDVGVPGYASLLSPYNPEHKGALMCLNNEMRSSLEGLNGNALSADEQIDFDILYGALLLQNQHLIEIEPSTPNPAELLPIYAIYQLTIRTVEDFEDALLARLTAIPAHLAGARDHLHPRAKAIPHLWLESAATAARRGVDFLQALSAHPRVATSTLEPDTLRSVISAASRALIEYAEFLERDIGEAAEGNFACGESYFQNLLRYRHFLDIEISQLYGLGQRLFARTERELKAVSRELYGHGDIARATKAIQADHPSAGELLATYKEQMRAARDFVERQDLVSVPRPERLDVVETPVFMRHQIPFAAYSDPAPNDPDQQGHYYVTPPTDDEQLAEHNYAGLMHTCVHEAYPGHHLQFVTANLNGTTSTLPRLLNASATLYEGWALYCEQLMFEQGFLNRPEQRFILLKDRLWRALRILIDVEIHTRGTSIDEVADRMVAHLGFPRSQALADLKWYSQSPAVPMGYATGWALINAARDQARLQDDHVAKAFHDRLLCAGSIALALVIKRVFGEPTWQQVKRTVFTDAADETT
ncbi:MAG: DUF885 domain-containing protein [Acidiferrobacterales bacterium]